MQVEEKGVKKSETRLTKEKGKDGRKRKREKKKKKEEDYGLRKRN